MNHEDGFLSSILADPDDDVPRLVYADWLEDHGEPRRAAFIRAQCRLARLDEDDPGRPSLVREEAEYLPKALAALEAKPRPAWLAKLPGRVPQGLGFARGFPASWTTTANRFIQKAAELTSAVPIQHARLTNLRDSVDALARCPALANLVSLDLSDEGLPPDALRVLIATQHLGKLRRLCYRNGQLTNEKAIDLARAEWLSGVRELDLHGNSIRSEGFEALAASPHLGSVELLDLGHSSVGPRARAGGTAGDNSLRGQMRKLCLSDLSGPRCRPPKRLAGGSDRLDSLSSLDLAYNSLGLAGNAGPVEPFRTAGSLAAVRWARKTGPRRCGVWNRQPRLRGGLALHLLGEGTPVEAILGSLLASCRELGLPCTHLGDVGAGVLAARSPAVSGLTSMNLLWCDLTDVGFGALAGSPHLAGLRELVLEHATGPRKLGIAALLEAPFARRLTLLDLRWNSPISTRRHCARLAESPALEERSCCCDCTTIGGTMACEHGL